MYKSVRILQQTYDIIEHMAKRDRRTIVATIDYIVEKQVKNENREG